MAEIGYTLSSEEFGPRELVRFAERAEQAGFDFASISDHFHPWVDAQGNSPFVWATLGGVAEATERIRVGTGVSCPTMRQHPALVAQAAATVAVMFEGRFFLGVGSGEALNEHILGEVWPETKVRQERLEEAITVVRLLWEGGLQSHHGDHYTVENARIYTLPDEPPPVIVATAGDRATEIAGRAGDGMFGLVPDADVIAAFEDAGGKGKPRYGQMHVCWAESEDEAKETAHRYWPNAVACGQPALGAAAAVPLRERDRVGEPRRRRRGDRLRARSGADRRRDKGIRRRRLRQRLFPSGRARPGGLHRVRRA